MTTVLEYLEETEQALGRIVVSDVEAVVNVLWYAHLAGRKIFILGNGGSAANAMHFANDLNKFCNATGRERFRAMALTDAAMITAIGNDASYAEVFVSQLHNWLNAGDVVIALSTSGNSPNVILAVEFANTLGAKTIGLCGATGGKLKEIVGLKVIIPAGRIGQQEDGHLILAHAICLALRERLEHGSPSAA